MSLEHLLWKIPTDFIQKYDFPELMFLAVYLKSEKDIITQTDSAIQALEEGYKAQHTAFSASLTKRSSYAVDSSEDAVFRQFIDSHRKLSEKFNKFATLLTMLRATKSSPLVEAYNNNYKALSSELMKLKGIISDPMKQLQAAQKSYSQYLAKLLDLANARKQISQGAINQQLPKVLAAVDTKLQRVQAAYLGFRAKYVEYCQTREAVFAQAEILLHDSAVELKKVLKEAASIDKEMFEGLDLDFDRGKTIEPPFWTNSETKKKNEKFVVTVDRNLEIDGVHTITPSEKYFVIDAAGDDWQIQDKDGQAWRVPSEFLVPLN